MALVRYARRNPWREMDQLSNRLNTFFNNDFLSEADSATWLPAVDVQENAEDIVLTAELPGMKREDIDIELENNVLTIRGERSVESDREEEGRFHVMERRYGAFQRSFTLPRTVQPDGIAADYTSGVLEVRMPKAAEAKGRRIQIGSGAKK